MLTTSQVSYKKIGVFEMLRLQAGLVNSSLDIQIQNANAKLFNIKVI